MNKNKRVDEDPEILDRLRQVFAETGMKHREFAHKLDISRSYVGKILSGRVQLSGSILKKMAKHGFDIFWILTGTSERQKNKEHEAKQQSIKNLVDPSIQ